MLVGKGHVVSRRDGDLTLADDQSVSRRHAVITVEHSIKDMVRNFKTKIFYQNMFHLWIVVEADCKPSFYVL